MNGNDTVRKQRVTGKLLCWGEGLLNVLLRICSEGGQEDGNMISGESGFV